MTEITESEKPPKPFNKEHDLNALEHVLIGSSTQVNGEEVNFRRIIELIKSGVLTQSALLIPNAVSEEASSEDMEALQRRREEQKDLVGTSFGFLDMVDQHALSTRGKQIWFQPIGMVHVDSGKADPLWRVSVVDAGFNKSIDPADTNVLKVNEFYSDYLRLTEIPKTGSKILHFTGLSELP